MDNGFDEIICIKSYDWNYRRIAGMAANILVDTLNRMGLEK
jgi:hypothetical protein